MKRMFSIVIVFVMLFTVLPVANATSTASTEEDEALFALDKDFLSQADIRENELEDGSYEIELTRVRELPMTRGSGETSYEKNIAKIIAFDKESRDSVKNTLSEIEYDKHGKLNEFSGSLIMECTVFYYQKSIGSSTLYKITNIMAYAKVNSGTSIAVRKLGYACIGAQENGGACYIQDTIDITKAANPYNSQGILSFPYVYDGGLVAATFYCSGKRPNGTTSQLYKLPVTVTTG